MTSAAFALAVVAALSACSDDTSGGTPNPTPDGAVADGNTVTGDGAVVDQDGQVVDATPPKTSLVNVTNVQLTVLGDTRDYVLSVPKTYSASRSYPLIIVLHGDGDNATSFQVTLGLDEVAGNDAIMAYPDQVFDLATDYDANGDQQLVAATIADVSGKYKIDAGKIWGFGYSKGGFMLNQLMCRKPGLFKAVAAHATGAPEPLCNGTPGIPIMETMGDQDTMIGADFAANFWASNNGCAMTKTPGYAADPASCSSYDNCPAGKQVIYCLAPGVSHAPLWSDAVKASWAFFRAQ
ncbi:MAG: Esterase lipoprotein LpqC [Labilithrix sp.]|nr:Esterase lipoprotein LpqC [Labilithrix sp.]